jgi:hypothetical protein
MEILKMNKAISYLNVIACLLILTISGCHSIENNKMVLEQGGTGFYKAVVLEEKTLPGFTIYRPENMSVFGDSQKLPIILWANVNRNNTSDRCEKFLNEIASYGYLVIAAGSFSSLSQSTEGELVDDTKSTEKMLDSLSWAIVENYRKSSEYYGKIDIAGVAVAGPSCDELQVIEASMDSRVTTSIICDSGAINTSIHGDSSTLSLTNDVYKILHAPILYLAGDASDSTYTRINNKLQLIDNVPIVMMFNQNTGLIEAYKQPHGGDFAIAAIAWLDWQLKSDPSMFNSIDCGCSYASWEIEYRNFE